MKFRATLHISRESCDGDTRAVLERGNFAESGSHSHFDHPIRQPMQSLSPKVGESSFADNVGRWMSMHYGGGNDGSEIEIPRHPLHFLRFSRRRHEGSFGVG